MTSEASTLSSAFHVLGAASSAAPDSRTEGRLAENAVSGVTREFHDTLLTAWLARLEESPDVEQSTKRDKGPAIDDSALSYIPALDCVFDGLTHHSLCRAVLELTEK
jgi:hypothetical protein